MRSHVSHVGGIDRLVKRAIDVPLQDMGFDDVLSP